MAKTILRTDNVKACYSGHIYSVVSNAELQNGFVGHIGNLVTGEREIRNFDVPTTGSITSKPLAIIMTPELNYSESRFSDNFISNFSVEAGKVANALELQRDDILSISTDGVDAINSTTGVVVGNYLVAQNGSMKLKEVDTLAGTEKFVARIEAIESFGTSFVTGQAGVIGDVATLIVFRVLQN